MQKALRILHKQYEVPNVVMSSMPLQGFLKESLPDALASTSSRSWTLDGTSHLICLSSSRRPDQTDDESISAVHAHVLPCLPGYFSGVGDLFSSLVLAHFNAATSSGDATQRSDARTTPVSRAASLALSKTFAILRRTHDLCTAPGDGEEESLATDDERDKQDPERRVRRMKRRELRLIEGQDILRSSPTSIPASTAEASGSKDYNDETGFVRLRELQPWPTFWSKE